MVPLGTLMTLVLSLTPSATVVNPSTAFHLYSSAKPAMLCMYKRLSIQKQTPAPIAHLMHKTQDNTKTCKSPDS